MSGRLLQFPTEDGEVLIAVPVPPGMVQPTGRLEDSIEAVSKSLTDVLQVVAKVSKSFRTVFLDSGADAAEMELGLQCTGKGNIYVVETTGQAAFKVTLSYTRKQQ